MSFERTLFDIEQDTRALIFRINDLIESNKKTQSYTCVFTIILPISSYKAIKLFCPDYIIDDRLLGHRFYTIPNGLTNDFMLQIDRKYDVV